MESELGRITFPGISQDDLALARTLVAESTDPRVQRLCRALLELEPKLGRLQPEIRRVFQELQRNLDERQRR
jgi:hypothetical protein